MSDQAPSPKPTGTKPSSQRVFKPRAGIQRRSAAEVERYAKEEAERQKARSAEGEQKANLAKTVGQGVGRGRGRGGANAFARGGRTISDGVGRSVFGAGTGEKLGPRTRGSYVGGQSEMLDGQIKPEDVPMTGVENVQDTTAETTGKSGGKSGSKKGGAASGAKKDAAKAEDVVQISEDDEPDEQRRDIEEIWLSGDEEDEEDIVTTKGKQKASKQAQRLGGGLRPVRAARAAKEEPEELFDQARKSKVVQARRDNDDQGLLEMEEDADIEMTEPTARDSASSPEISKRAKPVKRPGTKAKDVKFSTETLEEKAERLRDIQDIRRLRSELTPMLPTKSQDRGTEASEHPLYSGEGKLFLFQLPPMVPFLTDPDAIEEEVAVKQEGEEPTAGSAPATNSKDDNSAIKKDQDGTAGTETKAQLKQEGCYTAADKVKLPKGLLGKLRVHKSGKVSLDWGGTDMEVRYGTEVDFLQDAVLVETPIEGGVGTTYALGQVQKKMVVVPDWSKLYD